MPMPMLPPAPLRLSTTTCCFQASVSLCATRRATSSVGPAGGNGTIARIGREGYCWANAYVPGKHAESTANVAMPTIVFMIPPWSPVTASLCRYVRILDDLGVARGLGCDESGKLFRRAGERFDAAVHEPLPQIGRLDRLDDLGIEPADEICRRRRRRKDPVPQPHDVILHARIPGRGHVGQHGMA